MTRKIFYIIILLLFSIIFIYTILQIFVFTALDFKPLHTSGLKSLLALSIILYESISAKKIFRTINLSVFPIVIIGYLFSVMHWPFGLTMFLGSLTLILTLLVINAIKNDTDKVVKIIILSYPISSYILMITKIYRIPSFWFPVDIFIIGLTTSYLWFKLLNTKKV
jgi:hypothetical protein